MPTRMLRVYPLNYGPGAELYLPLSLTLLSSYTYTFTLYGDGNGSRLHAADGVAWPGYRTKAT